jgi:hypothetical protein
LLIHILFSAYVSALLLRSVASTFGTLSLLLGDGAPQRRLSSEETQGLGPVPPGKKEKTSEYLLLFGVVAKFWYYDIISSS